MRVLSATQLIDELQKAITHPPAEHITQAKAYRISEANAEQIKLILDLFIQNGWNHHITTFIFNDCTFDVIPDTIAQFINLENITHLRFLTDQRHDRPAPALSMGRMKHAEQLLNGAEFADVKRALRIVDVDPKDQTAMQAAKEALSEYFSEFNTSLMADVAKKAYLSQTFFEVLHKLELQHDDYTFDADLSEEFKLIDEYSKCQKWAMFYRYITRSLSQAQKSGGVYLKESNIILPLPQDASPAQRQQVMTECLSQVEVLVKLIRGGLEQLTNEILTLRVNGQSGQVDEKVSQWFFLLRLLQDYRVKTNQYNMLKTPLYHAFKNSLADNDDWRESGKEAAQKDAQLAKKLLSELDLSYKLAIKQLKRMLAGGYLEDIQSGSIIQKDTFFSKSFLTQLFDSLNSKLTNKEQAVLKNLLTTFLCHDHDLDCFKPIIHDAVMERATDKVALNFTVTGEEAYVVRGMVKASVDFIMAVRIWGESLKQHHEKNDDMPNPSEWLLILDNAPSAVHRFYMLGLLAEFGVGVLDSENLSESKKEFAAIIKTFLHYAHQQVTQETFQECLGYFYAIGKYRINLDKNENINFSEHEGMYLGIPYYEEIRELTDKYTCFWWLKKAPIIPNEWLSDPLELLEDDSEASLSSSSDSFIEADESSSIDSLTDESTEQDQGPSDASETDSDYKVDQFIVEYNLTYHKKLPFMRNPNSRMRNYLRKTPQPEYEELAQVIALSPSENNRGNRVWQRLNDAEPSSEDKQQTAIQAEFWQAHQRKKNPLAFFTSKTYRNARSNKPLTQAAVDKYQENSSLKSLFKRN